MEEHTCNKEGKGSCGRDKSKNDKEGPGRNVEPDHNSMKHTNIKAVNDSYPQNTLKRKTKKKKKDKADEIQKMLAKLQ